MRAVGLLAALMLAACAGTAPVSTTKPREPADGAPRTNAATIEQLARLPNPQVQDEKRSKWGNGPVYTVLGKSYRVMDEADGFVQEGLASWYGTKFHGRRTSNGEQFDMYGLTAAHRHLPLPTFVEVTNLRNGRSTIVRVNDRGPFHSDRVIDLSYAAAVKLGFHNAGTARVRLKVVSPNPQPDAYFVQTGAFKELANADRLQERLRELTGIDSIVVSRGGFYRVQLGPVAKGPELDRIRQILDSNSFGTPHLLPSGGGD